MGPGMHHWLLGRQHPSKQQAPICCIKLDSVQINVRSLQTFKHVRSKLVCKGSPNLLLCYRNKSL